MDIPSLFDMLTWELDLILVGLSHHRLFWDLCLKQIYLPWIHAISQMKSNRSHRSQSLPWLLPCYSSRASSLWAQPLHLNGAFFSPNQSPVISEWLWGLSSAWLRCHRLSRCGTMLPIVLLAICTQSGQGRLNLRQNKQNSTVLSSLWIVVTKLSLCFWKPGEKPREKGILSNSNLSSMEVSWFFSADF